MTQECEKLSKLPEGVPPVLDAVVDVVFAHGRGKKKGRSRGRTSGRKVK